MSTFDSRYDAMQAARAAGEPDSVIAERHGITRQRVHRILGARPAKPETPAQAAPPLGPLVRAWRQRHGITQAQAAARFGVNVFTVSKIETGRPAKNDAKIRNIVNSIE